MNTITIAALVVVFCVLVVIFRTKKREVSHLPPKFVVVDIETTGLSASRDKIIELAAIKVDRDHDRHVTFQVIINPGRKLPDVIKKITKLTEKDVKNGDSEDSAMRDFLDFIGDSPLVFYNASFDMGFLSKAAGKVGYLIDNDVHDALHLARSAFPGLKNFKLVTVASHLRINTRGAHRALADAEMTRKVFHHARAILHNR